MGETPVIMTLGSDEIEVWPAACKRGSSPVHCIQCALEGKIRCALTQRFSGVNESKVVAGREGYRKFPS